MYQNSNYAVRVRLKVVLDHFCPSTHYRKGSNINNIKGLAAEKELPSFFHKVREGSI